MSDIRDEFLDLLARERQFLKSGNYDGLARLAELKASLTEKLENAGQAKTLAAVLPELKRNAALLDASRQGLKQSQDRIREIRRGLNRLSVYDAGGQRNDIPLAKPKVHRTA